LRLRASQGQVINSVNRRSLVSAISEIPKPFSTIPLQCSRRESLTRI
jgi:hypothetical protein